MKFFITLCLVGVACAAVDEQAAQVLKSEFSQTPEGGYQVYGETSNGLNWQQNAVVKPSQINKDEQALEIQGSYSYQAPDGQNIQVTYVANEYGFQPQGNHLPTTPEPVPIPDYIQRALQYIKDHPYEEKKVKRSAPPPLGHGIVKRVAGTVPPEVVKHLG